MRWAAALLVSLACIPASGEPLRIIAIGDSITQGGRLGVKEFTYRWPLVRMLRDEGACFDFIGTRRGGLDQAAQWPEPWDDHHEGYYGAKTAAVRDRLAVNLPKLPAPQIALVHLGTNDMAGSIDSDIINPMHDIVTLLRKANPLVKVFIAQIPAGLVRGTYLHFRMERMAAVLSTEESLVQTIDLHTGWKPAVETFDGVHPNLMGQRWIAEQWMSAIRPYLPAGDGCQDKRSVSSNH